MGNFVVKETADLFDPGTGQWVGVIDAQGREQVVINRGATSAPATLKSQSFSAKAARVRGGTGDATVLLIGHSMIAGYGAGGSGTFDAGAQPKSLAPMAAKILKARGYPASAESYFGLSKLTTSAFQSWDPRVVAAGSGWDSLGATSFPGSFHWRNTSTTDVLSFTASQQCDRWDVWYLQNSGWGSFDLDIGGANLLTTSSSGSSQLRKVTVSGASNVLNLRRTTASVGWIGIVGVVGYPTGQKSLNIIQIGSSGAKVADILTDTTGSLSYTQMLLQIQPALVLLGLDVNDWNAPTPIDQFEASQRAAVVAAQAAGATVGFYICRPSAVSGNSALSIQQAYRDVLLKIASDFNLPVNNVFDRYVSYETQSAVSAGNYLDLLHGNTVGYAQEAKWLADFIESLT